MTTEVDLACIFYNATGAEQARNDFINYIHAHIPERYFIDPLDPLQGFPVQGLTIMRKSYSRRFLAMSM